MNDHCRSPRGVRRGEVHAQDAMEFSGRYHKHMMTSTSNRWMEFNTCLMQATCCSLVFSQAFLVINLCSSTKIVLLLCSVVCLRGLSRVMRMPPKQNKLGEDSKPKPRHVTATSRRSLRSPSPIPLSTHFRLRESSSMAQTTESPNTERVDRPTGQTASPAKAQKSR